MVKTWKPRVAPLGHEAELGYGWPPDLGRHDFCYWCPNCQHYVYGEEPVIPCPQCGYTA